MATTNPGDKLVTTSEVKIVNDKLNARIQVAENAGGDNATAITALQTTTATHTTQIQTNATEIQGIKDSVATMAEFKQYLGITDD